MMTHDLETLLAAIPSNRCRASVRYGITLTCQNHPSDTLLPCHRTALRALSTPGKRLLLKLAHASGWQALYSALRALFIRVPSAPRRMPVTSQTQAASPDTELLNYLDA